ITGCETSENFSFNLQDEKYIGFITPTYFLGLPTVVNEFLDKLELHKAENAYVFTISTYGTTSGQTGRRLKELFQKKGISINASYGIKMVDTWTPVFDLTDKDKISQINDKAESQIAQVCTQVKDKIAGEHNLHKVPGIVERVYYPVYKKLRRTQKFHLEDGCISCGKCAKKCPTNAIAMKNGKPEWVKTECTLCLGCLHRCPNFVIQYGKKTKNHGQFLNPYVRI
ncbi:MAG: EFR1 family ferrodoxin, partial [Mobilitalea sp.]